MSPRGDTRGQAGGTGRQPFSGAGEGSLSPYRARGDVLQARVLPLHHRQEVRLQERGCGVIPVPGTPPGGGTCPPQPRSPQWSVLHPWEGKQQIHVAVAWTTGAVMGYFIHCRGCRRGSHSPVSPANGHQLALGACRAPVMVPVQNNEGSTPRPAPSSRPYLGEVPNELLVIAGQQGLDLLKLGRPGRLQPHSMWRHLPETPPDISRGSGTAGAWPSPGQGQAGSHPTPSSSPTSSTDASLSGLPATLLCCLALTGVSLSKGCRHFRTGLGTLPGTEGEWKRCQHWLCFRGCCGESLCCCLGVWQPPAPGLVLLTNQPAPPQGTLAPDPPLWRPQEGTAGLPPLPKAATYQLYLLLHHWHGHHVLYALGHGGIALPGQQLEGCGEKQRRL